MSDALYHDALKALAHAATGAGRLDAAQATATLDNPLCGDRVTLDVRLEGGRVVAIGHQVRGCLLCQAASSALAGHVAGLGTEEAALLAAAVTAMLKTGAEPPFPALAAFLPVRAHKSRHDCVLLPFKAMARALG
jgi:NifU-like protein involved in Fe-S cluster formation